LPARAGTIIGITTGIIIGITTGGDET